MRPAWAAAVLGAAALLGSVAAAGAAYEELAVKDGGVLSGVVRYAGVRPRAEVLAVARDQGVCGESRTSEALVVGQDGGVRGAVVLVEGVTRGKKTGGDVVVESRDCRFVPHVTVATVGERVRVANADTVLHHPKGLAGRTPVFELALPGRGQTIDVTRRLTRPGAVRLVCEAHPHMSGWLVVHDSPYHAVTDEHGAYRVDGIPPGTYRVTLWHEGFRPQGRDRDGRRRYEAPRTMTKATTIAPNGAATLDFELR